jgi:hypothetical protein
MSNFVKKPTGAVTVGFEIPCGVHDDPRECVLRAFESAVKLLKMADPELGLPLEGTLRDEAGYCGSYKASVRPQ